MPRGSGRGSVLLSPAAASDIEEAFAYITERNAAAARALIDRLADVVERLRDFPEMGSPLAEAHRGPVAAGVRLVAVEPYVVFYRELRGAVVVLRVLHARRDSLGDLLE